LTGCPPSCILRSMMQRTAIKILDLVCDMRYTTLDMHTLGFHLINLSPLGVRDQLVEMANSIKTYNDELPGVGDGQYTLF
jgi:hypothetical protein